MSHIYDNWERLVAATLKKQQLWELFHQHSRSPSVLSESSSFSSSSSFRDVAVDFSSPESAAAYWRELEEAVAKSEKLFRKLVFVSEFSQPFDVEHVVLASAKFLGRGLFGSAYAAAMGNGVRIVVKRLNLVSTSVPEFKRYMDVVGSVKHENVVALRAYYERLMLYDYHKKSMFALLHGQIGEGDWDIRLNIAIGAARGIAEIHRQNGGKFVHGNIKSSNIFLNAECYGCVSDLGLANIIEASFPSTAHCYAPEVKNTKKVSQASDVYSFGILLLELLTRKSPKVVDLVKLVTSVKSKERASKVFDAELLKHPNISEQMVNMLQIGINCVAKSQKKRPTIYAVAKILEDIWMMNQKLLDNISMMNHGYHVSSNLVFVDDANLTFDLKDLLRTSAEVLGKGTFGTSYKATLGNGVTIRVKRLRDVTVTSKEFQQHMQVIGRMWHRNVAELSAYCYSNEEKLLVDDYYGQGSIIALLHGNTGAGKTHLDWETRLNIAIGAARGIAYIHRQDGQKLVHGNIKSSNILLDVRRNSIVCDAGHTRLLAPLRWSAMPSRGYCAPEVADTRRVSQKSDVYSFGVVLLELVTGRPSEETNENGELITLVNWFLAKIEDDWVSEVFDAELLRYGDKKRIEEMLQIASVCVNTVPERRPTMFELVGMLEKLSGIEPSVESRMEDVLQDTGRQSSLESRLEYILEDMLPTMALLEV